MYAIIKAGMATATVVAYNVPSLYCRQLWDSVVLDGSHTGRIHSPTVLKLSWPYRSGLKPDFSPRQFAEWIDITSLYIAGYVLEPSPPSLEADANSMISSRKQFVISKPMRSGAKAVENPKDMEMI